MDRMAASIDGGQAFFSGNSGKWAAEQLLKALKEGRPMSPDVLRAAGTLRNDEWIHFDQTLVTEAAIRLNGIADLISRGLTRPVANAMGKTMLEYEKMGDMTPAILSMDGVTRSENDRIEFELDGLPLPIIHKDFYINLRTLAASREKGEALDTIQVRVAGRLCSELAEYILFRGTAKKFGGRSIYGYLTHPDRNTVSFGTGGAWGDVGKTGAQIQADTKALIQAAHDDRMYGPYILYVSPDSWITLGDDFKADGDKTVRQRIEDYPEIKDIKSSDQLPADTVLLVQMTPDVVELVTGEALQTVQWDFAGGFQINFKAFLMQTPLVKSDASGRSGIVHMS